MHIKIRARDPSHELPLTVIDGAEEIKIPRRRVQVEVVTWRGEFALQGLSPSTFRMVIKAITEGL